MKPTDEQIKEFYTKILDGKVEVGTVVNGEIVCYRRTAWNEQDEEWNIAVIPRTDSLEYLGWLFKYAMPKLHHKLGITIIIYSGGGDTIGNIVVELKKRGKRVIPLEMDEEDPALALFWAIYEVLKDS